MTGSRRRRAPTLTLPCRRGREWEGAAWVTAVWLLMLPGLLASAVSAAEPPPGASSCSGCHPPTALAETKVPPLRGQNPADIAAAMQGLPLGRAPVDGDGPNSERVFRRGDPGDRRLGCGTTVIRTTRRAFLTGAATAVALSPKLSLGQARPRIIVLGGGFAGATCARALRRADPQFEVTLVEPNPIFTACPFSNAVIAGLRDIEAQRFGYDAIHNEGIAVVPQQATAVNAQNSAGKAPRRVGPRLRSVGAGAGDRDPLGCAARLR